MGDRLSTAGFATAHVAALTVAAILLLHLDGALGAVLEPVGTLAGTVVFLVLWGVALRTHRRGFASADPWAIETLRDVPGFLLAGAAWGAATGTAVFWLLAGGFLAALVAFDSTTLAGVLSVPTLLFATIGTAISLAVGAAVGLAAAALDALAVGIVDRLDG